LGRFHFTDDILPVAVDCFTQGYQGINIGEIPKVEVRVFVHEIADRQDTFEGGGRDCG
jgi:hypothetical protein